MFTGELVFVSPLSQYLSFQMFSCINGVVMSFNIAAFVHFSITCSSHSSKYQRQEMDKAQVQVDLQIAQGTVGMVSHVRYPTA